MTELLAVLATLALLAALLLPTLARSRTHARSAHCLGQLHQLALALALYADDHQGLLPAAHAEVPWDATNPPPWTRPLLPFYRTTNLLTCPAYSRVHLRSPFNYFMGGRSAFVEAGGQPASVTLARLAFPAQFLLSGDCNYPFRPVDADPDNYTYDTLFGTNRLAHRGRVNILFGDKHVTSASHFDPLTMTFSTTTPGVTWELWSF